MCLVQGYLTPPGGGQIQTTAMLLNLRVFFSICILRAGFDRLTNEELDDWRLQMFPESLLHLVTNVDEWREHESRVSWGFYCYITAFLD